MSVSPTPPTWLIQAKLDFINWTDITSYCSKPLNRKMQLHNQLKSVTNTLNLFITDQNTANALNLAAQNVPFQITKDGSLWFVGMARPSYQAIVGPGFQGQSIQIYDYSIWLKQFILSSMTFLNSKVSDPTDKAHSILHQL